MKEERLIQSIVIHAVYRNDRSNVRPCSLDKIRKHMFEWWHGTEPSNWEELMMEAIAHLLKINELVCVGESGYLFDEEKARIVHTMFLTRVRIM